MNSATHSSSDDVKPQTDAGATGVVLFCCIFLLCLHGLSSLPTTTVPPVFHLRAEKGRTLALAPVKSGEGRLPAPDLSSPLSARLTPFYFQPLPINSCDQSLLMTIKGIGPSLAKRIISTREQIGAFLVADDLLQVSGIGPKRLQQFSSQFTFAQDLEAH